MIDQPSTDERGLWRYYLGRLFADLPEAEQFYVRKPLLAHYTSVEAVEAILRTDQVWFSSPLLMNDHEEVAFGILHGVARLKQSQVLGTALGKDTRRNLFARALDIFVEQYGRESLPDLYVFCLSEHDKVKKQDGRLSMWRGYGSSGGGAAIIFDTSKLNLLEATPLILAKVHYGSDEERFAWMDRVAQTIAVELGKVAVADDDLHVVAAAAFERIKLFAVFTKHIGFCEEQEWRIVYMPERDEGNKLARMFGYLVGPRGMEPKLKLEVGPIEGVTASDLSLAKIIDTILLGPTASSTLSKRSFERMLDVIGKGELKDRVRASHIPFRG